MSTKRRIYICDSHKPKIHGGGCCSDKGSQGLLAEFSLAIHHHQLENQVELIPTTCLSQCKTGISVRIWPDQVVYGRVKPEDVSQIVEEHLLQHQPVKRLEIVPEPRFLGW